jgi:hypothetical protein
LWFVIVEFFTGFAFVPGQLVKYASSEGAGMADHDDFVTFVDLALAAARGETTYVGVRERAAEKKVLVSVFSLA